MSNWNYIKAGHSQSHLNHQRPTHRLHLLKGHEVDTVAVYNVYKIGECMNWKEQLYNLEKNDDFDVAIFFMQQVIDSDPNDIDAYISIIFRLMYMIVEGPYYCSNVSRTKVSEIKKAYYASKRGEYAVLARKYFREGQAKFSENAEFLYYDGTSAAMSEWYLGIDREDYEQMLKKAKALDPQNMLYKWLDYYDISKTNPTDDQLLKFLRCLCEENSPIQRELGDKGALGEYILSMMMSWAERMMAIQ